MAYIPFPIIPGAGSGGGEGGGGAVDSVNGRTGAVTLAASDVGLGNVNNVSVTTAGMGVVAHGSNASTARPTGFAQVTWVGSVSPTNAAANDVWYQP